MRPENVIVSEALDDAIDICNEVIRGKLSKKTIGEKLDAMDLFNDIKDALDKKSQELDPIGYEHRMGEFMEFLDEQMDGDEIIGHRG